MPTLAVVGDDAMTQFRNVYELLPLVRRIGLARNEVVELERAKCGGHVGTCHLQLGRELSWAHWRRRTVRGGEDLEGSPRNAVDRRLLAAHALIERLNLVSKPVDLVLAHPAILPSSAFQAMMWRSDKWRVNALTPASSYEI